MKKTEAAFVGHVFLAFLAFSLGVFFLGSLDLLTSTAASAVFCCPSIFSSSSHIIAPFMRLLDFEIILAALTFMVDGTLSFTSSMLNGLQREAVVLAETSWIASFTGEPCAIVLIRPSFISAFFGRSESHLLFPSQS
jgi:hypothetical protein